MMRQFTSQDFCIQCKGCCRFKKPDSVWAPKLLRQETNHLLNNKDSKSHIDAHNGIKLIQVSTDDCFLCPFLDTTENKCRIYHIRPLDCMLYPFLLSRKNDKVYLALHAECPFVSENLNSEKLKEHTEYLKSLLENKLYSQIIKDNPQLIQGYPHTIDLCQLEIHAA